MPLNIITTPQILDDSIYTQYGGQTGTSTVAQRTAAYAIAEGQAVDEIGTFVIPTVVTGTYSWPPMGQFFKLPFDRLASIASVTSIHETGCECASDSTELEGCAWIIDPDFSIVDLRVCGNTLKWACSACSCRGGVGGLPKQFRIVYTAGLPAGAASDPRLLQALTVVAEINLWQVLDPHSAEGGPGDPGVQKYSVQGYSEERTPLRRTAFGSSARANFAAKLLRHFREMGALKLGW